MFLLQLQHSQYCTYNSNVCLLTVVEQACHPVVRQVPDQECTTVYEQQCVNEEQTTYETSHEQSCQNVPSQVIHASNKRTQAVGSEHSSWGLDL